MFGLFKNSSREWCCAGFKGRYEQAGHRGFSVLIEKDEFLGARFSIQSRAVESSDQERFCRAIKPSEFPVSIATETGVMFCPWCGVNLKRFYGKRTDELTRSGFSIPLFDGPSPR